MDSKYVDRLSKMPDEVLSYILSLMPTKYAVRTSILSKGWRYNWKLVTNVCFDDIHPLHGLKILSTFVDRVLDQCKTSEIRLFRLHFIHMWVPKSSISKWINEAVRLNVREIEIKSILVDLPLSLFTCKTLVKFKIEFCYGDWDTVWDWPSHVKLPCLKTLDISLFVNPSRSALKLIRGCPILESLSLNIDWATGEEEEYIVNVPSLKHLKLTMRKSDFPVINKVVLNVPNLEDLFIGGQWCALFVMEDFPSQVSVRFSSLRLRLDHLWAELLKGISGAKSLLFDMPESVSEGLLDAPLPNFPNLKHLELTGGSDLKLLVIFQFLESCSNLDHLSVETRQPWWIKPEQSCSIKQEQSCWIQPHSIPTCILNNLTTMKFESCMGRKDDIQFLKYILENAQVLKTLTITCKSLPVEEETLLRAKLVRSPRASKYCDIHIVGKSFDCATS